MQQSQNLSINKVYPPQLSSPKTKRPDIKKPEILKGAINELKIFINNLLIKSANLSKKEITTQLINELLIKGQSGSNFFHGVENANKNNSYIRMCFQKTKNVGTGDKFPELTIALLHLMLELINNIKINDNNKITINDFFSLSVSKIPDKECEEINSKWSIIQIETTQKQQSKTIKVTQKNTFSIEELLQCDFNELLDADKLTIKTNDTQNPFAINTEIENLLSTLSFNSGDTIEYSYQYQQKNLQTKTITIPFGNINVDKEMMQYLPDMIINFVNSFQHPKHITSLNIKLVKNVTTQFIDNINNHKYKNKEDLQNSPDYQALPNDDKKTVLQEFDNYSNNQEQIFKKYQQVITQLETYDANLINSLTQQKNISKQTLQQLDDFQRLNQNTIMKEMQSTYESNLDISANPTNLLPLRTDKYLQSAQLINKQISNYKKLSSDNQKVINNNYQLHLNKRCKERNQEIIQNLQKLGIDIQQITDKHGDYNLSVAVVSIYNYCLRLFREGKDDELSKLLCNQELKKEYISSLFKEKNNIIEPIDGYQSILDNKYLIIGVVNNFFNNVSSNTNEQYKAFNEGVLADIIKALASQKNREKDTYISWFLEDAKQNKSASAVSLIDKLLQNNNLSNLFDEFVNQMKRWLIVADKTVKSLLESTGMGKKQIETYSKFIADVKVPITLNELESTIEIFSKILNQLGSLNNAHHVANNQKYKDSLKFLMNIQPCSMIWKEIFSISEKATERDVKHFAPWVELAAVGNYNQFNINVETFKIIADVNDGYQAQLSARYKENFGKLSKHIETKYEYTLTFKEQDNYFTSNSVLIEYTANQKIYYHLYSVGTSIIQHSLELDPSQFTPVKFVIDLDGDFTNDTAIQAKNFKEKINMTDDQFKKLMFWLASQYSVGITGTIELTAQPDLDDNQKWKIYVQATPNDKDAKNLMSSVLQQCVNGIQPINSIDDAFEVLKIKYKAYFPKYKNTLNALKQIASVENALSVVSYDKNTANKQVKQQYDNLIRSLSKLENDELEAFIAFAFKLSGNHLLGANNLSQGQSPHPIIYAMTRALKDESLNKRLDSLILMNNPNVQLALAGKLTDICTDATGGGLINQLSLN